MLLLWLITLAAIGWMFHLNGRVRRLEAELAVTRQPAVQPKPAPRPAPPTPQPVKAAPQPVAVPPMPTPPPQPPRPAFSLSAWLSENGLAWIGGGALALGGLFLVAYAVQQGFFTPAMRIGAAIVAGLVMLAGSEALRRASGEVRDYRLAAALAAGAGAATLYASVWASHELYAFIGASPAAVLLALVSLGLLALAFRHGQPLALLALGGALAAPLASGAADWSPAALSLYLAFIIATGFSVAGARRWPDAGFVTLIGSALWALIAIAETAPVRAGLLGLAPAVGALAATFWRRRTEGEVTGRFGNLPAVALVVASLLALGVWLMGADHIVAAAATGAGLILLSALGAGLRLSPGLTHTAPVVALSLGAAFLLAQPRPGAEDAAPWVLGLAAVLAGASLTVALKVRGQTAVAVAGAVGAVVLLALALWTLVPAYDFAWGFGAAAALLLAFGAGLLAQQAEAMARHRAAGAWAGSASAALFLTVYAALNWRLEPAGLAASAALIAALFGRLGWRTLSGAALVGALLALAGLMRPNLVEAALSGDLTAPATLALGAAVAGLLFAAAWLVERRKAGSQAADALGVAAVIAALWTAFLVLRVLAEHDLGGLDFLTESSLRTLLLLTAGLLLLPGPQPRPGLIGRWRGEAFLALGALHGVLCQGVLGNPLWGLSRGSVVGPPGLDSLALAFLAPALILVAAVWRSLRTRRAWRPWMALAALGSGLVWIVLAIRRAFHGPDLDFGAEGPVEFVAYALVGLCIPAALDALATFAGRRFLEVPAARRQIGRAAGVGGWTALALALAVFGLWASPWWGPPSADLASTSEAAWLLTGYGAGALLLLAAARAAPRLDRPELGHAALACAVLTAFVLITLALRFAFHGVDMRGGLVEAGLETWAYSAAWALFGATVLSLGAARRSLTLRWAGLIVLALATGKVFLFDMAELQGVVRAGSFLALGALLLSAAVAARRYGRGWLKQP